MNHGPYRLNFSTSNFGTMKVNGVGTIRVKPNLAVLNFGIVTENTRLQIAQQENAVNTTNVINKLLSLGIPMNSISTSNYNIEPQYDYVNGKQSFRSYRVTNELLLNIADLNSVGIIIDEAVKAGANRVNSISFRLDDSSYYYLKALNLAVKDAVRKSKELGNSLGVEVADVPYKTIEETSAGIFEDSHVAKTFQAATTPIIPKEIEIVARIEAYFSY